VVAVFGAGKSLVFGAGEACGLGEGAGDFLGAANVAMGVQQAKAAMHAVMILNLFFIIGIVLGIRF
jgi:hypothetical protein